MQRLERGFWLCVALQLGISDSLMGRVMFFMGSFVRGLRKHYFQVQKQAISHVSHL